MLVRKPLLVSMLTLCALSGCTVETPQEPFAQAKRMKTLGDGVGGPKAIGRPGDFVLENDRFRTVILSGRYSMGPHISGGSLVDADLRRSDARFDAGQGRDHFNEMFSTVSMNIVDAAEPASVTIASDGSDGGAAVVRVTGEGSPFLSMLDLLWGIVRMPEMWVTTDYIAEPGTPWLRIQTNVQFEESEGPVLEGIPVEYPGDGLDVIGIGLETGVVVGDFFLAGGSLDVFAPGIGFDEDGAVFEAEEQERNIFTNPFRFPFVAGIGDGVSYAIVPEEGNAYVPLFTASQTAVISGTVAGNGVDARFEGDDSYSFDRYFLIGHGDIGSLVDQYVELRDIPHGTVSGLVLEQGTNLPMTDVDVFVFKPGADKPWSQWRTDIAPGDPLEDGSFSGQLPVGDWEIMMHDHGRPDSTRIPVTVTEGEETTVRLAAPRPGVLSFTVVDAFGEEIPSKVTIFRTDAEASRDPALGDTFIGGQPEYVVFADQGTGEVPLSPGTYYAVASRGIEYEIDVSDEFTIDETLAYDLQLQVARSVDTEGWISADLHVHSSPSHDSGVSPRDRIRTMVAEGVEFFSTNDHDVLSDFAPDIEDMGLERWVRTAVGVETTTVELGHYLAFPLRREFLGDVGGAMDWTGMTPSQIVEDLRAQGQAEGFDPLVFVAHPRDGILGYFDQYGFDPFDSTPNRVVWRPSALTLANPLITEDEAMLEMDAIELFTAKREDQARTPLVSELEGFATGDGTTMLDWTVRTMEEQEGLKDGTYLLTDELEGTVDDWFALLNIGYRHTALGNSDTHGTTSTEAGCPRNFVASPTDSPVFIRPQEVANAVKEGRVIASYGPFVTLEIDGAQIGDELKVDDGQALNFTIRAQAPSWMDLTRVELYENGELIREFSVDPGTPTTERFLTSFEHTPAQDSWYVVIVNGEQSMAPVFTQVEIPYIPLEDAVIGALGGISGIGAFLSDPVPFPKVYPIHPYALANPIWIDVGGDGFEPPGKREWFQRP